MKVGKALLFLNTGSRCVNRLLAFVALAAFQILPKDSHMKFWGGAVEFGVNASCVLISSIITEYLREQHARCKNPVTTCPPFSLFTPHQCPESKQRRQAPTNFTPRHTRRVVYPKYGGVDGGCFDRHLIFSRYCCTDALIRYENMSPALNGAQV